MYGQMTAGSWIYIGSQGIVQGTYETYAAVANKHFANNEKQKTTNASLKDTLDINNQKRETRNDSPNNEKQETRNASLKGTLNVTAGLGGMGGAQPLAIIMNEGVALVAEVEEWRIDKRIETKYLDEKFTDIDEAIDKAISYKLQSVSRSIGVVCNAIQLLQRLIERNIIPDTLTDQTSAHDPLIGYVPHSLTNEQANILRQQNPTEYIERSYESMHLHVQLMLQLMDKGAITFDYGNNIRARAQEYEQRTAVPDIPYLASGLGRNFDFPALCLLTYARSL